MTTTSPLLQLIAAARSAVDRLEGRPLLERRVGARTLGQLRTGLDAADATTCTTGHATPTANGSLDGVLRFLDLGCRRLERLLRDELLEDGDRDLVFAVLGACTDLAVGLLHDPGVDSTLVSVA